MGLYTYRGEAEIVITNSLDGPRVLASGDVVRLADNDESLDGHPLFEPAALDAKPAQSPTTPESAPEPDASEPTA